MLKRSLKAGKYLRVPRGESVSPTQRLKLSLEGKASGRRWTVWDIPWAPVSFEAAPSELHKKTLNLNTPKQGKHYRKLMNGNNPVKMAKNYGEKYEIGNGINYYNLLSGASGSVLTHESRPAKTCNPMTEL